MDGIDEVVSKLAVYGTLRRGCANHRYIADGKYVGTGELQGWNMYSNGSYPYVVKSGGSIKVEIFEIAEETLSSIDDLEGYPMHYDRTQVETQYGKCWLYFVRKIPSRCFKIESGDWLDQ